MCESLTDSLKVLSNGDTGFQNIQKGVSNILGVIGAVATSFSNNSAQSSKSMDAKV